MGLVTMSPVAVRANICVMKPISVPQACGTVLDITGEPISEIDISLEKSKQTIAVARTDSRGSFRFESIDPGQYELVVRSPMWDSLHWPIRLTSKDGAESCRRPIWVSVAPGGMFCKSRVSVKKPKRTNAQTH